jgi:hypothetical protein
MMTYPWVPPIEDDYKLLKQVATLQAQGESIRSSAVTVKRSPTTIHELIRVAA